MTGAPWSPYPSTRTLSAPGSFVPGLPVVEPTQLLLPQGLCTGHSLCHGFLPPDSFMACSHPLRFCPKVTLSLSKTECLEQCWAHVGAQ